MKEIASYPDVAGVARWAARRFVEFAAEAIQARHRFCVALSGGTTPGHFFRTLASGEYRDDVRWDRVHVFWSDERAVPPDHADSNYGLAHRELLVHVPLPQENMHRMEAERGDSDRAAQDYEKLIQRIVPADDGLPRMDLIYLGLGTDGHTASLFPRSPALEETQRLVVAARDPRGAPRMTFTVPLLTAARHVIFLVAGREKAAVLRDVMRDAPSLPASHVAPRDGSLEFLVDREAAELLPRQT